MAEYIDKEKAINAVFEAFADGRSAYIALETIPSADVQPIRHGRWKFKAGGNWYGGGGYECSACKYGYAIGAYHEPYEFTYCPNYGAKMDGGET